MKRTPLKRLTGLRQRSARMAETYRTRRVPLVKELLAAHPVCERCNLRRSTEVHELLSRARGGSILDVDGCVALCHECHHWITTHPAEATATGWLRNSWDAA